jgi:hypothetical protein
VGDEAGRHPPLLLNETKWFVLPSTLVHDLSCGDGIGVPNRVPIAAGHANAAVPFTPSGVLVVRGTARWTELRDAHDRWVADFNYHQHWAHRERQDGQPSPVEGLSWVHGTPRTDAELARIFRVRAGRRVDLARYVRYRHWRLYAERGFARRGADL